jgi:hypothetical protein
MLRKPALVLAFLLLFPRAGICQPEAASKSVESVTVTGLKPSTKVIDDFIFAHAKPTRLLGKLARWQTPICPETRGLRPAYAKFISQHIREIAAKTGAPVNDKKDCKPNINVVFTTAPQQLLDNLRLNDPLYLGYYESRVQLAEMGKFIHPIQSWYTTATMDQRGNKTIDSNKPTGLAVDYKGLTGMDSGGLSMPGSATQLNLGNATVQNVSGSRLGDGLSSGFFNVLIVGEPAKMLDYEMSTLADYIAMLALADPGALDTCAEFPTILNLLVPGCARIAPNLTEGDIAYLKALYKITPNSKLLSQRGEMRYQMQQALK